VHCKVIFVLGFRGEVLVLLCLLVWWLMFCSILALYRLFAIFLSTLRILCA